MAENERTPLKDPAGPARPSLPYYTYFVIAMAALNSINLGFDIGVSSGVAVLVKDDFGLSDIQIGMFMGSLHWVSACGGLMNHVVSDRLGRRLTFTVAQVIIFTSVVVLSLSGSFLALMFGRIAVGLGIGISLAIDAMYIAELSPASHRGSFVAWAEISVCIGLLIGFTMNWVLSDLPQGINWRVMIACGAILPVAIFHLSLFAMPESPRWLIAQGRLSEAEAILIRTHSPGLDIPAVVGEIKKQVVEEEEHSRRGWALFLYPDAPTRRMLLVGIGIAFAQQINGSESVVLYSPEIYQKTGVAATNSDLFAMTMATGFVKASFVVVSACLLDSVGRRPLMLVSMFGLASCQVLLASSLAAGRGRLAVVSVWLFIAFFSVGIGTLAWLVVSEVFPLHARAKAMSLATAVNRATSGLIALTFLPVSGALGLSGYFFFFAFVSFVVAGVAYVVVPETKQQTLEQLAEHFRDSTGGETAPPAKAGRFA